MLRKTMLVVGPLLCLAGAAVWWSPWSPRTYLPHSSDVKFTQVPQSSSERMKRAEVAVEKAQVASQALPDRQAPVAQKKAAPKAVLGTVQDSNGLRSLMGSSGGLGVLGGKSAAGSGLYGGSVGLGGRGSSAGGGGASASVAYGSAVGYGRSGVGRGRAVVSGGGVTGVSSQGLVEESPGNTEGYHDYGVNPWVSTLQSRLSTFAVDVDTASYTIARRKITEGMLPPKDSVRVEEFLNYFHYDYQAPLMKPLAVFLDAAPSPFTPGHYLLRVGLQGKKLSMAERKPAHLTFLVDVSGSMQSPDKLPLLKRALRLLVDNLTESDTVSIVTYASGVRLVLPPTGVEGREQILSAIEELQAGGSTNMASGFDLAYKQAMKTLDGRSVSRVLILSDGDANVGPSSHQEILQQIRGYVKEGIMLSTFGFGMGNYKDEMMEQLADRGNGNYFYIDSLMQARRVFQEQLGGTLEVIAQDVKLQLEFDPDQVKRYRLVGYENRHLANQDFRNDKVDAGEMGAGHSVTALYELELAPGAGGQGLAAVHIRAKRPRGVNAEESTFDFPASALARRFEDASADLRFATAVMGAAEIFRQSPYAAEWSYDQVVRIARGASPRGNAERQEFISLLERARTLVGRVAER